ncbi:hypothetical protein [Paenibacillus elgii]|uniref:hypothetical protein n=1 Tax=Paenibacillus elgii TaxID=189691 RepID=UPI000248CB52|nr:hypothetical protein [Paenibacillus elgii]MCM3268928.1 hypothetical protein [Paenibacillus elgii]
MIFEGDITNDSFKPIGFRESHLFFNSVPLTEDTLRIGAWGIDVSKDWCVRNRILKPDEGSHFYLAGMAKIEFHQVSKVSVSTVLYHSLEQNNDFVRTADGSKVSLAKEWAIPGKTAHSPYVYRLTGILDWPHGYCELDIHAEGPVRISFDPGQLVNVSHFFEAPQNYAYPFV